jgi:hypothetical protein
MRKLRADGWTLDTIASKFSCRYALIQKHFAGHEKGKGLTLIEGGAQPKTREMPPAPKAPELPPTATPRERAQAQCEFLDARMNWSVENGVSGKDIAALSGQITNATRLLARLSGSLEVTEAQIIRSVPFQRILGAVIETLAGDRKRLEELERKLATLAGESK